MLSSGNSIGVPGQMKSDPKQLAESIRNNLPIAATVLVDAGYVSRTTLWRLERAGMPVLRIGRRIFVRFSDLTEASATYSATDD